MTREEIESCWEDPNSWKWYVYYCKADPRAIVPRRLKWMGWTLNFARPSAILVLLCMVALIAIPVAIVRANGGGTAISVSTGALSIGIVCLLSAYLSSSKRWNH